MRLRVFVGLAGWLAGCSPGSTAPKGQSGTGAPAADIERVRSDCDPLAPTVCGFPFPSTFFMREDATSETGWRVALGPTTLPVNANGYQPVPDFWNERDGWSILTPAIVHLPDASVDNLPQHEDLGASLDDDSDSILFDLDTGERVPHFVERDVSIVDDADSPLLLHPVRPLAHGHRYVVAFRNVATRSGDPIQPSEAFVALRDGIETDTWDVEGRRAFYDDALFPALEAQGWSRGEVQLAWDFVTGSQEGITGRARRVRDLTTGFLPADGPTYVIDEVQPTPNASTAFRVEGRV